MFHPTNFRMHQAPLPESSTDSNARKGCRELNYRCRNQVEIIFRMHNGSAMILCFCEISQILSDAKTRLQSSVESTAQSKGAFVRLLLANKSITNLIRDERNCSSMVDGKYFRELARMWKTLLFRESDNSEESSTLCRCAMLERNSSIAFKLEKFRFSSSTKTKSCEKSVNLSSNFR